MKSPNHCFVGQRDGRRAVQWPGVCFRAVLWVVVAAAVFIGLYLGWFLCSRRNPLGVLQTWVAPELHLTWDLLVWVAAVLVVAIAAPLAAGLRCPVERLPDFATLPRPGRLERFLPFALACLVTLIALFYGEEDWRGKRAWEGYRRQLAAQGEAMDLAAFLPPPVPADQNFAMTPLLAPLYDLKPGTIEPRDTNVYHLIDSFGARYARASSLAIWPETPWQRLAPWGRPATDLRAWYAGFLAATNAVSPPRWRLAATNAWATNVPLAQAAAGVLAGLSECRDALEELRAGARRPRCRFDVPYTREHTRWFWVPHLSLFARAGQVLGLRASAELAVGQTDSALADTRLILDLADAIRDEPFEMSFQTRLELQRHALQPLAEGLARRQWPEPALQALEDRLRRIDVAAEARRALQAERARSGGLEFDQLRRAPDKLRFLYEVLFLGNFSPDDPSVDVWVCLAAAPSGWYYLEQLNCNRFIQEELLPVVDAVHHRIDLEALRKAEKDTAALSRQARFGLFRHEVFLGHLVYQPVQIQVLGREVASSQTGLDQAVLACALERFRLARGEFPETLEALAPEFLTRIPRDVLHGQPPKYRRTEAGRYVLSSPGWNGTDHGGASGKDWVW